MDRLEDPWKISFLNRRPPDSRVSSQTMLPHSGGGRAVPWWGLVTFGGPAQLSFPHCLWFSTKPHTAGALVGLHSAQGAKGSSPGAAHSPVSPWFAQRSPRT